MKRVLGWTVAVLVIVAIALGGYLYQYLTSIGTVTITDDAYMLHTGLGGNVGVLRTDAGTVIIDSMTFPLQGRHIQEIAEDITGKPVVIVINTHYHPDHTHGNPAFAGTRIIATKRTRDHLLALDGAFWEGEAAATLPEETVEHEHSVRIGGKTIRLLHPGRGHTDGDLIALFVEDRVLHMGDLAWNKAYPNIDLEAGGSLAEWPATIDRALELDFDHVIPGHGPLTDREGILAFRAFITELWEKGRNAVARGLDEEGALRDVELTKDEGYTVMFIPFVLKLDRDFVVRRAWQEASGNYSRYDAAVSQ